MPYGRDRPPFGRPKGVWFQSLIWVACPTGAAAVPIAVPIAVVSIPHMGCMPYGLRTSPEPSGESKVSIPHMGCMPYGRLPSGLAVVDNRVSIPHMGCMPYGPSYNAAERQHLVEFQSLIWVACPTGQAAFEQLFEEWRVSIPHMGCMPYGLSSTRMLSSRANSFNPSYGLHALRATDCQVGLGRCRQVSIPHMGCMPYGPAVIGNPQTDQVVSIPHMGCMPYGRLSWERTIMYKYRFQSLIWVACPTGGDAVGARWRSLQARFNPSYGLHALRASTSAIFASLFRVSIPHMGCMPYGHNGWWLCRLSNEVSIPHMGCMPYGPNGVSILTLLHSSFNPSYGLHALRAG